jgi:CheY-like chemotaxis protein
MLNHIINCALILICIVSYVIPKPYSIIISPLSCIVYICYHSYNNKHQSRIYPHDCTSPVQLQHSPSTDIPNQYIGYTYEDIWRDYNILYIECDLKYVIHKIFGNFNNIGYENNELIGTRLYDLFNNDIDKKNMRFFLYDRIKSRQSTINQYYTIIEITNRRTNTPMNMLILIYSNIQYNNAYALCIEIKSADNIINKHIINNIVNKFNDVYLKLNNHDQIVNVYGDVDRLYNRHINNIINHPYDIFNTDYINKKPYIKISNGNDIELFKVYISQSTEYKYIKHSLVDIENKHNLLYRLEHNNDIKLLPILCHEVLNELNIILPELENSNCYSELINTYTSALKIEKSILNISDLSNIYMSSFKLSNSSINIINEIHHIVNEYSNISYINNSDYHDLIVICDQHRLHQILNCVLKYITGANIPINGDGDYAIQMRNNIIKFHIDAITIVDDIANINIMIEYNDLSEEILKLFKITNILSQRQRKTSACSDILMMNHLIKLLNGHIHVLNMVTHLSFKLKYVDDISMESTHTTPFTHMTNECNIIIVDDNQLCCNVLCNMFNVHNYLLCDQLNIHICLNGKYAYEKYIQMHNNNQHIHLIVTDVIMPEINGIELTAKIREFEKNNKINNSYIVGLSGSPEVKNDVIKAGMNDFIIKPITIHKFKAFISTYLHAHLSD